jgi:hypothetical protein
MYSLASPIFPCLYDMVKNLPTIEFNVYVKTARNDIMLLIMPTYPYASIPSPFTIKGVIQKLMNIENVMAIILVKRFLLIC